MLIKEAEGIYCDFSRQRVTQKTMGVRRHLVAPPPPAAGAPPGAARSAAPRCCRLRLGRLASSAAPRPRHRLPSPRRTRPPAAGPRPPRLRRALSSR
jgi:hypothetical protein